MSAALNDYDRDPGRLPSTGYCPRWACAVSRSTCQPRARRTGTATRNIGRGNQFSFRELCVPNRAVALSRPAVDYGLGAA